MNDKLDWTSRLGEAFLAQPDDVQMAKRINSRAWRISPAIDLRRATASAL
jgi:hypothetical protein